MTTNRPKMSKLSRTARPNEAVADLNTGIVHAAKFVDEQGGSTWCAYTWYDPDKSRSPVDDFQGQPCVLSVTCMGCIAALSAEDAANAEEDAYQEKYRS